MDTKVNFDTWGENVVYVKSVATADLPDDVQEQVGDLETLFAVHNMKGEQLALVANKKLAFHLAAENNLQAVVVH
jgi:hypothetical protein